MKINKHEDQEKKNKNRKKMRTNQNKENKKIRKEMRTNKKTGELEKWMSLCALQTFHLSRHCMIWANLYLLLSSEKEKRTKDTSTIL